MDWRHKINTTRVMWPAALGGRNETRGATGCDIGRYPTLYPAYLIALL
jgi:hypothetical protein